MTKPMTPERKQEYKDSIDSALALLMDFRKALDNPQIVSSRCAYCDKTFGEVESGECPPALLEHAKTCSKSPPANEIRRLKKVLRNITHVHKLSATIMNPDHCKIGYTMAEMARKALEAEQTLGTDAGD